MMLARAQPDTDRSDKKSARKSAPPAPSALPSVKPGPDSVRFFRLLKTADPTDPCSVRLQYAASESAPPDQWTTGRLSREGERQAGEEAKQQIDRVEQYE